MSEEDILQERHHGPVLHLTINRPAKRNALTEALADRLTTVWTGLGSDTRAIVISAAGSHFCAGLDLSEQVERTPVEVMEVSRRWHAIKDMIQFGPCPVVAALHGAVIGGGFELAATAHVRIGDRTAFFQMPEGKRGIFIGGGGSVRIARLIGTSRLTELMLTGRRLDAEAAERYGILHQLVENGEAEAAALATALEIADNAPLVNHLILQALPRIADMSASDGLFTESLAAALSQSTGRALDGMDAFLKRRSLADGSADVGA